MTTTSPLPFRGSTSGMPRGPLEAHVRVLRDVYVDPEADLDLLTQCRATLVAVPDAVFDRWTAAQLWRLPVDPGSDISFTRRPGAGVSKHDDRRTRRAAVHPDDVDTCRGLPVTGLGRTFVDLAAGLFLEQLVAVGDVVCRRVGPEPLGEAVARARRRKGVVLAREAALLVDPGSESPAETRVRLIAHAAGLTGLRHGVVLTDEHGGWIGQADLADRVARVAVQYDGGTHFEDDGSRRHGQHDVDRDELARLAGWEVVVLTRKDLADPSLLVAKLRAAYARAADRARGRLAA